MYGQGNATILTNKVPYLQFEIQNSASTQVELPRLYYLGYTLYDKENQTVSIYENEYGFLQADIPHDGIYTLKYEGTSFDKLAILLRIVALIVWIMIMCKEKIIRLYQKYKEIVHYIIFGVLTTIVSIISYYFFSEMLSISYIISNILSWIIACLFAFITNRIWVFKSKNQQILKEMFQFFSCRIATLILELVLLYVMIDCFHISNMISKTFCQVVVIVLNYIFSKLFVFKK